MNDPWHWRTLGPARPPADVVTLPEDPRAAAAELMAWIAYPRSPKRTPAAQKLVDLPHVKGKALERLKDSLALMIGRLRLHLQAGVILRQRHEAAGMAALAALQRAAGDDAGAAISAALASLGLATEGGRADIRSDSGPVRLAVNFAPAGARAAVRKVQGVTGEAEPNGWARMFGELKPVRHLAASAAWRFPVRVTTDESGIVQGSIDFRQALAGAWVAPTLAEAERIRGEMADGRLISFQPPGRNS